GMLRNGFNRERESERPDLIFHEVRSPNIMRGNNRIVKPTSFGLAFSNRPISIDERVCLRLTEISTEMPINHLRFGVINTDPKSLRNTIRRVSSFVELTPPTAYGLSSKLWVVRSLSSSSIHPLHRLSPDHFHIPSLFRLIVPPCQHLWRAPRSRFRTAW
ncbi:hypothetical protein PENTCL1PPCAC_10499, partial [Pristionchus entomophagus]